LDSRAADIVRRALVLVSDHELNASTFAARIAVSTGAPLAAAALAGMAALVGPLHGSASARALALLDRMLASNAPHLVIRDALSRGERVSAFGHPLYGSGDVRAAEILRALKPSRRISRAIGVAEREIGEAAMLDMAFAAMTREFKLGDDAGFVIFAIGRMVGWIAHALEQHEKGRMIRPRARYIGP
jgi:citrate synthase